MPALRAAAVSSFQPIYIFADFSLRQPSCAYLFWSFFFVVEALSELLKQIERDEERKQTQTTKGLDGLTYFVLCKLTDEGVANAETASKKVREAFAEFTNWRESEKELRELRKKVTFAIFAEEDDLDKVTGLVDSIFTVLQKASAT